MDLGHILHTGALDASFPLPSDRPFTHAQAIAAGLGRQHLSRLCAEGVLRRPVRRVYLATAAGDSLPLRAAALRLVVPRDCVVVDRHAAWLLGAEMALAPNEHLHLLPLSIFRPSGHGRVRAELARSGERDLHARDIMDVDGMRVTTPLRTAWDLGCVRWPAEAIAGVDAVMRLRRFSHEELLAGVERFKGRRWITTLRAVAPLADHRSESPGESVLRLRCHECRLSDMVPQHEVWSGDTFVGRMDLADEAKMLAVEYDGVEWHTSPQQLEHDRARRRKVAEEGWLVKAFTAENLFGRHRDIEEQLHAARREALTRLGHRVTW